MGIDIPQKGRARRGTKLTDETGTQIQSAQNPYVRSQEAATEANIVVFMWCFIRTYGGKKRTNGARLNNRNQGASLFCSVYILLGFKSH